MRQTGDDQNTSFLALSVCKVNNNLAHIKSLEEWFLIFKRSISNRECREFLQIDDKYTAHRILQSMNFRYEGTFRNRTYIMDLSKSIQTIRN